MLIVIKFPYALKSARRDELMEKYTQMLREGNCVLISDSTVQVEVYSDEDIKSEPVFIMSKENE